MGGSRADRSVPGAKSCPRREAAVRDPGRAVFPAPRARSPVGPGRTRPGPTTARGVALAGPAAPVAADQPPNSLPTQRHPRRHLCPPPLFRAYRPFRGSRPTAGHFTRWAGPISRDILQTVSGESRLVGSEKMPIGERSPGGLAPASPPTAGSEHPPRCFRIGPLDTPLTPSCSPSVVPPSGGFRREPRRNRLKPELRTDRLKRELRTRGAGTFHARGGRVS